MDCGLGDCSTLAGMIISAGRGVGEENGEEERALAGECDEDGLASSITDWSGDAEGEDEARAGNGEKKTGSSVEGAAASSGDGELKVRLKLGSVPGTKKWVLVVVVVAVGDAVTEEDNGVSVGVVEGVWLVGMALGVAVCVSVAVAV